MPSFPWFQADCFGSNFRSSSFQHAQGSELLLSLDEATQFPRELGVTRQPHLGVGPLARFHGLEIGGRDLVQPLLEFWIGGALRSHENRPLWEEVRGGEPSRAAAGRLPRFRFG